MILAYLRPDRGLLLSQRLTDAVAAAGLRAPSSQKRRAVVLVTSDCATVSGQWNPEGVRRFLAQLRVPFRVWVAPPPAASAPASAAGGFCDGAQPIHEVRLLYAAVKSLRRDLASQQIVWVEGRHLLRKITLNGDEPGVRLAE